MEHEPLNDRRTTLAMALEQVGVSVPPELLAGIEARYALLAAGLAGLPKMPVEEGIPPWFSEDWGQRW